MSVDQPLESKYNKPAKGASGVIEITRRKAAVGKWNFLSIKNPTIVTFSGNY